MVLSVTFLMGGGDSGKFALYLSKQVWDLDEVKARFDDLKPALQGPAPSCKLVFKVTVSTDHIKASFLTEEKANRYWNEMKKYAHNDQFGVLGCSVGFNVNGHYDLYQVADFANRLANQIATED